MARLEKAQALVLIPAHNEERTIRRVVADSLGLGFPVLVVDDASSDRTLAEIADLPAHRVILTANRGKGAALREGFAWFLERDFKALIMMDADGQHDPAEIERFLEELEKENGPALLIGNRMQNPLKMPLSRRLTNRFLSWMLSGLTRRHVPDSQCGFRAVSREALMKMKMKTDRFEIESEMVLEAARSGCAIYSVPIRSVYEGSASQIRPWRDTLRFFGFIWAWHREHGLVFSRPKGEK